MNSARGSSTGTEPWAKQQGYLEEGWRDAANLWHTKKDTPYYRGQTLAGPTDYQRQVSLAAQQGAADIATAGSRNITNGQEMLARAMGRGSLGDVLAGADTFQSYGAPSQVNQPGLETYRAARYMGRNAPTPQINSTNYMTGSHDVNEGSYFAKGLDAALTPVLNKLRRETLPGIASNAIANGAYGGARQDITEGVALADAEKNLSDVIANAYLEQYGRERQIGAQQEQAASQLSSAEATRLAELASQNWATGEQLNTSRYNTTEQLRAGDQTSRNALNVDWAKDTNRNNLDWAKTQDQLGTQRWLELQNAANARNLNRDNINAAWDTSMLNMAPQLQQMGINQQMTGTNWGAQAGAQEQAWQQAALDDAFNNWQNAQNWDWNNLKQYTGIVQGYNPGLVQNNQTSRAQNILGGILGGAAGGYGLQQMMPGMLGQNGAGYGAILGGLLGMF